MKILKTLLVSVGLVILALIAIYVIHFIVYTFPIISMIGCAVLFLVFAYLIVTEFWDDKNAV